MKIFKSIVFALAILLIATNTLATAQTNIERFRNVLVRNNLTVEGAFLLDGSGTLDLNGKKMDLDADADTSLTADTDDTIDFEVGGADEFEFTAGKFQVGDASAGDDAIVYDGNAQDFYVALDDSADDLVIGVGATVGTSNTLAIDEDMDVTLCDASATDCDVTFDGNAQDFYVGLDDGTDDLIIGLGATVGTTPIISMDENQLATFAAGATVTTGDLTVTAGDLIMTAGGVNLAPQGELLTDGQSISSTTVGLISLTSSAEVTTSATVGIITTTATSGDVLILANNNAADVINVDGTGGSIECKANVALGASDTLTLWYNGTDSVWNCIASYDNS